MANQQQPRRARQWIKRSMKNEGGESCLKKKRFRKVTPAVERGIFLRRPNLTIRTHTSLVYDHTVYIV
jgi:hypothetical protein